MTMLLQTSISISKKLVAPCLSALSLVVLLAACGGDSGTKERTTGTGPVVTNDGTCKPDNLTATCTCADQGNIPGRQVCSGGAWSACECLAAPSGGAGTGSVASDGGMPPVQGTLNDPPGNSSPNRFVWKRTPFDIGSCKAGHYVGTFMGFYGSPIIFGAPFPVTATDTPAGPGLEFTLEKVPGSGELFAIKGGKMRGNATGVADFTADLTGTLDCATKKYVGTIDNGEYIVLANEMAKYKFVGTMTADYDKIQHSFINGLWKCTEPPSTTIPPGGDGQWTTTWQIK